MFESKTARGTVTEVKRASIDSMDKNQTIETHNLSRLRVQSENYSVEQHTSSFIQNPRNYTEDDVLARYFDFGSDFKKQRPIKGHELRSKLSYPGKQDIAKRILGALQDSVNKQLQDEGGDVRESRSIMGLTK
jgi:hypothetical protein